MVEGGHVRPICIVRVVSERSAVRNKWSFNFVTTWTTLDVFVHIFISNFGKTSILKVKQIAPYD